MKVSVAACSLGQFSFRGPAYQKDLGAHLRYDSCSPQEDYAMTVVYKYFSFLGLNW